MRRERKKQKKILYVISCLIFGLIFMFSFGIGLGFFADFVGDSIYSLKIDTMDVRREDERLCIYTTVGGVQQDFDVSGYENGFQSNDVIEISYALKNYSFSPVWVRNKFTFSVLNGSATSLPNGTFKVYVDNSDTLSETVVSNIKNGKVGGDGVNTKFLIESDSNGQIESTYIENLSNVILNGTDSGQNAVSGFTNYKPRFFVFFDSDEYSIYSYSINLNFITEFVQYNNNHNSKSGSLEDAYSWESVQELIGEVSL